MIKRLVVLFVAVVLLASCGSDSSSGDATSTTAAADKASSDPIELPFVAELSGPFASVGRASVAGAQTAVKAINDAGGVNGRPIELKISDTQSNPTVAAGLLRDAIRSKPPVVVTMLASATMTPSLALVSQSNQPWIMPSPLFGGLEKLPFVFSVSYDNDAAAKAQIEATKIALGGSLKGKKLFATASTPSPIFDARVTLMEAAVKKAGGNLVVTRDPLSLSNWTSQAAAAMNQNPDAILIMATEAPAAVIAKGLAVAGYKGPIVSGNEANSDALLVAANLPNLTVLRDAVNPAAGMPIYDEINAAKVAPSSYGLNVSLAGRAYTMMHVVARALAKCGIPCPAAKYTSTVRKLGEVDPKVNPLFGPVSFAKSQSGMTAAQVYSLDPSTQKGKAVGDPIKVL